MQARDRMGTRVEKGLADSLQLEFLSCGSGRTTRSSVHGRASFNSDCYQSRGTCRAPCLPNICRPSRARTLPCTVRESKRAPSVTSTISSMA
eukprot:scaffold16827_cov32-Tisochrysis_lutea.AAC.3